MLGEMVPFASPLSCHTCSSTVILPSAACQPGKCLHGVDCSVGPYNVNGFRSDKSMSVLQQTTMMIVSSVPELLVLLEIQRAQVHLVLCSNTLECLYRKIQRQCTARAAIRRDVMCTYRTHQKLSSEGDCMCVTGQNTPSGSAGDDDAS
jgi:hypothetical protein